MPACRVLHRIIIRFQRAAFIVAQMQCRAPGYVLPWFRQCASHAPPAASSAVAPRHCSAISEAFSGGIGGAFISPATPLLQNRWPTVPLTLRCPHTRRRSSTVPPHRHCRPGSLACHLPRLRQCHSSPARRPPAARRAGYAPHRPPARLSSTFRIPSAGASSCSSRFPSSRGRSPSEA